MEALQKRYLRWVIEVKKRAPGYLIREELQREKLRARAGIRAGNFEKRLERGEENRITRDCREEILERVRRGRNYQGGKRKDGNIVWRGGGKGFRERS